MATYGCIDCRRCSEMGFYICDCDKPGRLTCGWCHKRCEQRHGATCGKCNMEFVRCGDCGGLERAWEDLEAHDLRHRQTDTIGVSK